MSYSISIADIRDSGPLGNEWGGARMVTTSDDEGNVLERIHLPMMDDITLLEIQDMIFAHYEARFATIAPRDEVIAWTEYQGELYAIEAAEVEAVPFVPSWRAEEEDAERGACYIAYDDHEMIWGVGPTPNTAKEDAARWLQGDSTEEVERMADSLETMRVSAAMEERLLDDSDMGWTVINGVAHLSEETE